MRYFILLCLLVMVACQAQEDSAESGADPLVQQQPAAEEAASATATSAPTATEPPPPTPTALPTAVVDEPTAEPADTPAPATADVVTAEVVFGRTDEGVYFVGVEDAPVTVIDYSDFL